MDKEDHDTDCSDSTVLLNNYNDKQHKNEVKRRRISNLYERTHLDQYEDENTAPDVNANRRTARKSRTWRISKYFTSIDSNLQINDSNQARTQIPNECKGNPGETLMEDEIICISDDDLDTVNNAADLSDAINDNKEDKELINARLTVLKPSAINARRATTEIFPLNDVLSNGDDIQRVNKNIQSTIRVLRPSAINTRRITTSFEDSYSYDKIDRRTNIAIHKDAREQVETNDDNRQAVSTTSELNANTANINVTKNYSIDMEIISKQQESISVAPDNIQKICFEQNVDNDSLIDAKVNKRLLGDDETTPEPKRSRTGINLDKNTDIRVANTGQAGDLDASKLQTHNRNLQAACDMRTSDDASNNQIGIVANEQNKNEARKTHSAHVLKESILGEESDERQKAEAPIREATSRVVEHVKNIESNTIQKRNSVENEQAFNETQSRQSNTQDKQIICESLENQATGISVEEQEQNNPHDRNEGTNTFQNKRQTESVQDDLNAGELGNDQYCETLQKLESFKIQCEENEKSKSNTNQKVIQNPVGKTSEPSDNEVTVNLQELQSSGMAHLTKSNNAITVDVPPSATLAMNTDATTKKREPKPIHANISETAHIAIKKLIVNSSSSLNAFKNSITAQKVDPEKLAPLIEQCLNNAVMTALKQNKLKSASRSLEIQVKSIAANENPDADTPITKSIQISNEVYTVKSTSEFQDAQINDAEHDKQISNKTQQCKPKAIQEKEKQTRSDALDTHVDKVLKTPVISEAQNTQVTNRTREKQISSETLDNHETVKIRDESGRKEHGKHATENAQDISEEGEQYYIQGKDKIQNGKSTNKVQETGFIQYQTNVASRKILIAELGGRDTTESQEKQSNVDDNELVTEALDNEETSHKPQTKPNVTNDQEVRKTQDNQDVRPCEDFQDDEIRRESQVKDKTETVEVVRKTSETHNGQDKDKRQGPIDKSLLQFQICFFSITKDSINTGVDAEFATYFENVIQTLRANLRSGNHKAKLLFRCPKCDHQSTFFSSLPDSTNIEATVEKSDNFQKCVLCSGITKLYITYLRRYLSKRIGPSDKVRVTNGAHSIKDDFKPPVKQSGKNDKRKCNELNDDVSDPKRMRDATEHNNKQNDGSINMSKDKFSDENANLTYEQSNRDLNVPNNSAITKRFAEVEATRHDGTKSNLINKSLIREEESEKSESNLRKNTGSDYCENVEHVCDNTLEKSSKEPTSESLTTSNLTDIALNKGQTDVNVSNSNSNDRKNKNTVNDDKIEHESNELPQDATKGSDSEHEISDDTEHDINQSSIKALQDCFAKINNVSTSKEETGKKDEPQKERESNTQTKRLELVSAPQQKQSTDKLPEVIADNRPDIEYMCPVCYCVFVYPSRFLNHLKGHDMNPIIPENCIRRKCKHCNVIFKCKGSFNKHVREYHSNIYEETISKHRIHNGKNASSKTGTSGLSKYRYRCTKCDKLLKTDYAARNHKTQKHPEFKYQKIYEKVVFVKQNNEQDKINDSGDEELNESEDDSQEVRCADISSEDEEENQSAYGINSDGTVECCISDESSLFNYGTYSQDKASDGQINDNNNRKKTKRRKANANKEIALEYESESEDTCSNDNRPINVNNRKRHVYQCKLCKITFPSDWAVRKHRMYNHPDMKGAPLFKKIRINSSQADGRPIPVKEGSSSSESEPEELHAQRSQEESTNNDDTNVEVSNSDEEITNATEDSVKKRLTKIFGHESEPLVSDKTSEKDYELNALCSQKETTRNNDDMIVEVSNSDEEITKATEDSVKKREERLTKIFGHESEPLLSDKTSEKDYESNVLCSQKETTRNNDDMNVEVSNSDEVIIKATEHSVKKRGERLTKIFDDESEPLVSDKTSEKDYESHALCSQKETTRNNDNMNVDVSNSDEVIIKATEHSVKKRGERLTKIFDDESEPLVSGKISDKCYELHAVSSQEISTRNDDSIGPSTEIEVANVISHVNDRPETEAREDKGITPSENMFEKRKKHIQSFLIDENDPQVQDSGKDSNKQTRELDINDVNDTAITNFGHRVDDVTVNDKSEKKHERLIEIGTVEKEGEKGIGPNTPIKSIDISIAKSCEESSGPNESNVGDKSKTINMNELRTRDSDQIEIDMIDTFLEELDRQDTGPHTSRSEEEIDDRVDQTEVSKNNMEVHDDKDSQVSEKTCLDKIEITNVITISDNVYLFICQECYYATDTYDDTIRHSQNHFNHIQDPVICCNICRINYNISCHERHQASHDKYLKGIKVSFSYEWLFSKWHLIFENIPLSLAEEMQIKSIYRTFSVKMSVKEDGVWQNALYLCGKCNTCIPPGEIEKHVRQKCPNFNYICSKCDRAFLTYEMREHHKIYHTDNSSKLFKIIVFNEKDDEAFNLKLLRAKLGRMESQGSVDVFKCLCGLCFGSLKKLKLHFVGCESDTNDSSECPVCKISHKFSSVELDGHLLLHASGFNDFRVQKICFQVETNHDSSDETIVETSDMSNDEANVGLNNEDDREILKEEFSSQENNIDTQGTPTAIDATEADKQVKKDLLKDEVLSQGTIESEPSEARIDANVESISGVVQRDFQFKRDLLKEASLSQVTIEEQSQMSEVVEDLQVKRDLLKDELLSQETVKSVQSEAPISNNIDREQAENDILNDKMISQEIMEVQSEIISFDIDKGGLDQTDSQGILVQRSEQLITIDDSDYDSDVMVIE